MSEVETKRIHISGLNPIQCSVQDLHARFESLQLQVLEVHNWPPGKNGVDQVQNWCFLTLKGEASKIKRATEVLNGTIWKGSKLRIGSAKKEKWKEGEQETKIEEEAEQSEEAEKKKRKKKKRSKAVESQKVNQPVTIKDVEAGEWGWKTTPAGHLLRPLHLRPSHPLPLPSARPVAETEGTEKKERKRKAKSTRALTRAKRVTVDPSRYGAVHLAGPILDDGSDPLPSGSAWACQETENGDVEWLLKDKEGNMVRQEIVKVVKEVEVTEPVSDPESEFDSEDDSSMDEVAAAINNAVSDVSSGEEEEEVRTVPPSALIKAAEKSRVVSVPFHDDGEDSDFSEGYQEVQPGIEATLKDWREEKASHLELLKNMFGDDGVSPSGPMIIPRKLNVAEDSEEEGEEEETETTSVQIETPIGDAPSHAPSAGAQKRAALLGAIISGQTASTSFNPVMRFDPGKDATQEDRADVEMGDSDVAHESRRFNPAMQEEESDVKMNGSVSASESILPVKTAAAVISPASHNDRGRASDLTELFKPQEQTKGFSLLGDLELDLDLEEEDEDDEMLEVPALSAQQAVVTHVNTHRAASSNASSAKLPLMFPSLDANDRSWFSILRRDSDVASFCKNKTDEEIQAQWKERKGQLTQDYKRRHREALKKKKRKYTGSRAAGTSMPLRS